MQNGSLADSPSISQAVTRRCWLQFTYDLLIFLLLLVPSWLLQSYASCLMPCLASWSVVVLALLIPCIGFFWLPQLVLCFGLFQPLLYNAFCYACWDSFLHFACWDSMSGFALACLDSMSGFPGLWLAVADICLFKGVHCKLVHSWLLFIVCTMMGC